MSDAHLIFHVAISVEPTEEDIRIVKEGSDDKLSDMVCDIINGFLANTYTGKVNVKRISEEWWDFGDE